MASASRVIVVDLERAVGVRCRVVARVGEGGEGVLASTIWRAVHAAFRVDAPSASAPERAAMAPEVSVRG